MQWPVRSSQAIPNQFISSLARVQLAATMIWTLCILLQSLSCNHHIAAPTLLSQDAYCTCLFSLFFCNAPVTSKGFVYAFSLVPNMQHRCFYLNFNWLRNWLRSWHWMIWVSERVREWMQLSLAPQIIVGQLLLRPTSASAQVLACQKGTITIDNTIDSRLQLVMEQARYLQHKTLC